jgi:hypothetical protein
MNKDVRIATDYPDHPKIRKLKRRLGEAGVMSHIFLLCYAARARWDGNLEGMDVADIAQVAQWRGDPDEFVQTLVNLRLLDQNSATYAIHNWPEHNFHCTTVKARSRSARRSAIISWLVRRNLIPKNSKIPPEIDLDQEPEKIAEQILVFNAKRNAKRNADRKAPSPPPPPNGRGGEVGGEDLVLEEPSSPPPPVEQRLLDSAAEIYTSNGEIDIAMERGWLLQYQALSREKQKKVRELAEFTKVRLPLDIDAHG